MSARIRSLKSNISKNKNIKIFSKTMTSNFNKFSGKSQKTINEFGITKSTRFSDNNITNTIASSIRTISKFRSRKKDKPIFINLDDFHKKFLLNKNKDYDTLFSIYTQNRYNSLNNTIKSQHMANRKNFFRLNKKSASPSFFTSSSINNSRSILKKKNYNRNIKECLSNSYLSSLLKNKNKNKNKNIKLNFGEISYIYKNKNNNTNSYNNNSNNFSNEFNPINSFKNISSHQNINEFDTKINPIKPKKEIKYRLNSNSNLLNTIIVESSKDNYNKFNQITDYEKDIKKKERKLNYCLGRNSISINEKLAYPSFNSYLFSHLKRFENNEQFLYKTKLMVLDKYIQHTYKNTYFKQMSKNENNYEIQVLNQRQLELKKKLFISYNKTLDEYLRYLYKKGKKMREENEQLKQNILKICMDIEQIRQQIIKGLSLIKEGFSIKFFLMCVKNHTLSLEKFEKEDIKIIEGDKEKLNENYYLNNKKIRPRKRDSKTNTIFLKKKKRSYFSDKNINIKKEIFSKEKKDKIERHNSTINVFDRRQRKSLAIFESIEEFFDNFNAVASKLNLLIKESNDKYANLTYLKIQLESIIKSTESQREDEILINNKIKICKQNLENLKDKNKKLSAELNYQMENKFKNDVKMILVLKNIYNIYNNIKKIYDIQRIRKVDILNCGKQIFLKVIEDFFLKIMSDVLEDKDKYPIEYEKLKQQMEKRKKEEAFLLFQRLIAQKIQIKIDAVLIRAKKVIYKRLRKTNDYKRYYLNLDKNKKNEKIKSDLELFLEYLYNNDY